MENAAKPAGVGTFIALSWRSTFRAIGQAPLVFALSFAAMAAISVGFLFLDRVIEQLPSSNWALRQASGLAGLLAALVRAALTSLALAPVAIVTHSVVIDGDTRLQLVGRYAGWLFGFLLFWKAVQLPTVLFGEGSFALEWLAIGIVGSVMLRSALLFPGLVVDPSAQTVKERVEAGWRMATGHLRRLFGVWLVSALPLIIVAVMLSRRAAPADAAQAAAAVKPALAVGPELIRAAVMVITVAISAAVTSWVYLWAQDHPREPVKP